MGEWMHGIHSKMQLKINSYSDIIVEWIPYDQFNTGKDKEINSRAS
jgi:hypothetical protein